MELDRVEWMLFHSIYIKCIHKNKYVYIYIFTSIKKRFEYRNILFIFCEIYKLNVPIK